MKIYDISQEVFSCSVYPGDPAPKREVLASMERGDLYDLTAFSMCAHNGTHLDAPAHFIKGGKRIEELALEKTVGCCFVAEHRGDVLKKDAEDILLRAKAAKNGAEKRILIKGDVTVTEQAAEVFAAAEIFLLGNESQTVGPEDAPMATHLILLSKEVLLLEGLRLAGVSEGAYMLFAPPLLLGGAEGAPCRALLVAMEENEA